MNSRPSDSSGWSEAERDMEASICHCGKSETMIGNFTLGLSQISHKQDSSKSLDGQSDPMRASPAPSA